MRRSSRAVAGGLAVVAALYASRATADDTVLCDDLTTPPGAVYLYGDATPLVQFASPYIHAGGDDYLLTGAPSGGAPVAGIATRSEEIAQAVRDALAPDHLDDVTGAGFVASPPTPSLAVVHGPTEAMVDQLVADLGGLPGANWYSTNQVNNSNKTVFNSPTCGIGCCSGDARNPKISRFTASSLLMRFNGNIAGCGILIVDGDLTVEGSFDFYGLLIVRGTLTVQDEAVFGVTGYQTTYGSVWAKGLSLGGSGGMDVHFSRAALATAGALFTIPVCQPSVCGDGVLTYDEECDDGNVADGDCCTSQCTVPTTCDDGSACTTNDHCEAGVCTGETIDCGRCQACDAKVGCHPAPAEGCFHSRAPWANKLEIRRGTDPGYDRLTWRWRRGEPVSPDAFGDPFTTDDYTLCVFGRRGRDMLVRAGAPAGGACGFRTCWTPRSPMSIRYRDLGVREGIASLRIDAGDDGKAEVVADALGVSLGLPALPLPLPLTVQLQAGNGACWEATYEARDVRQDGVKLRGRGRRP